GRGQIVSHNLYPETELAEVRAGLGGYAGHAGASRDAAPAVAAPGEANDQLGRLGDEIAALRAEGERVRERVAGLEGRLERGARWWRGRGAGLEGRLERGASGATDAPPGLRRAPNRRGRVRRHGRTELARTRRRGARSLDRRDRARPGLQLLVHRLRHARAAAG